MGDDYENTGYSDTTEEMQDWQNFDNSGTGEIGDYAEEYDMAAFDAATEAYLKENYPELAADATLSTQAAAALRKLGAGAFNSLKDTFTTKDGKVDWRSVAGAAGGLYGLYQANKPQEKVGFQGKIPEYTAVRERVPMTYDPTRRPGSSGQQYFTAPQFVNKGNADAVAAARTAALEQAMGLSTANTTNPARQQLPASTPVTSPAGGGTAVAATPRAASGVIKDLPVPQYAAGGLASMAQGRYLGGSTDGMADKIPARIGGKQEARLSHGEFVIPADVVSHLGNGNSEAGAKRLYAMMDKIRKARTGTKKQGKQINPDKFLA